MNGTEKCDAYLIILLPVPSKRRAFQFHSQGGATKTMAADNNCECKSGL